MRPCVTLRRMSRHSKDTRLHPIGVRPRGTQVIDSDGPDAYREHAHWPQPTVCPDCRATYLGGRWQWQTAPDGAALHRCPACRRTHDHLPAGEVHLEGDYFVAHRQEVMALIRARADRARSEHPLQRIMATRETPQGVIIETTDIHLAHGLGQAVHHAHAGELSAAHLKGQQLLRVHWVRHH